MIDQVQARFHLHGLAKFFSQSWYWIWGGIKDAGVRALNLRYVESAEFNLSLAMMLLGIWMTLPGESFFPGNFTSVLNTFLPDWAWGLLFIAFGRYGIHCMLQGSILKREWSVSFLLGGWIFLTFTSLAVHPFGIETILLMYMTWRTAVLSWQLGKV